MHFKKFCHLTNAVQQAGQHRNKIFHLFVVTLKGKLHLLVAEIDMRNWDKSYVMFHVALGFVFSTSLPIFIDLSSWNKIKKKNLISRFYQIFWELYYAVIEHWHDCDSSVLHYLHLNIWKLKLILFCC